MVCEKKLVNEPTLKEVCNSHVLVFESEKQARNSAGFFIKEYLEQRGGFKILDITSLVDKGILSKDRLYGPGVNLMKFTK